MTISFGATESDTIFALSSGALPAAIAVIRISGPQAVDAVSALVGPLPPIREARLRRITDPHSGELLDEGLVIWFPHGRSETGEDLVELHCHGSIAAVRAVGEALGRHPHVRMAQAGEFTRRAFLNGKTDLTRIEGLADLIHAETAFQRRAAMAMMGGALSRKIIEWSQHLRRVSAEIEAVLNFSDEGDVAEDTVFDHVVSAIESLAQQLAAELGKPSCHRLKDGIRVVIAGPPNVGKSTLLNALAGRDAAIVSSIAGTTRDVVEVPIAIEGTPFLLADTAGLHEAGQDPIEAIGMARAVEMMGAADIVLWLGEADLAPEVTGILVQVQAKSDVVQASRSELSGAADMVSLSAKTGQGMDHLVTLLLQKASNLLPRAGDYVLSDRQRVAIGRAHSALVEAIGLQDEILIAEMLRAAQVALDELRGIVSTEAMLDELFSGFCIGK